MLPHQVLPVPDYFTNQPTSKTPFERKVFPLHKNASKLRRNIQVTHQSIVSCRFATPQASIVLFFAAKLLSQCPIDGRIVHVEEVVQESSNEKRDRTLIFYLLFFYGVITHPLILSNLGKRHKNSATHTVDGQNPAPPRMMIIPLFIGF